MEKAIEIGDWIIRQLPFLLGTLFCVQKISKGRMGGVLMTLGSLALWISSLMGGEYSSILALSPVALGLGVGGAVTLGAGALIHSLENRK